MGRTDLNGDGAVCFLVSGAAVQYWTRWKS